MWHLARGVALFVVFIVSFSLRAEAQISLRAGYLSLTAGATAIWVAKEVGIFEKNGLNVELVYISPAVITQAILAGEPPIALAAGDVAIQANLRGADFVLVGSLRRNTALRYLVTHRDITRLDQLRGKKFGVSGFRNTPYVMIELALKKVGIDPKDVTFLVGGGSPQQIQAIEAKRVDASLMTPEFAHQAKKLGQNIILDLHELGIVYPSVDFATTRRFVKTNEDAVRRFVKSIVEGIHFYLTNKKKSMEITAKYTHVNNPEALEIGYKTNVDGYQRKPYPLIQAVKAVLEAMEDPKAAEASPEQFIDSRFVRELDESGFIDNLYK